MATACFLAVNYLMILQNLLVNLSCFKRNPKTAVWGWVSFFAVLLFNTFSYFVPPIAKIINDLPVSALYLIPIFLLNQGNFYHKIFVFSTSFLMTLTQFLICSVIGQLFFPYQSTGYLIVMLVSAVILFPLVSLLCKKYAFHLCEKLFTNTKPSYWGMSILLSGASLFILGYYYYEQGFVWHPKELKPSLDYILMPVFMVGAYFLLFSLIVKMQESMTAEQEVQLARITLESGKDYYQKLTNSVDTLREMRHDFKYHIGALAHLVTDNKSEEARRYLENLEIDLRTTEIQIFCENHVTNALITHYSECFAKQQTTFFVSAVLPLDAGINDYEICIVLGNLLQNALEACQNAPDPQRFVRLVIKHNDNQLIIKVINSLTDLPRRDRSGKLISTKAGGGYGTKSIKSVVQKYNGEFISEWTETEFTAIVMLNLPCM